MGENQECKQSFVCRFSCVLFISGLPRLSEMGMGAAGETLAMYVYTKAFYSAILCYADVSKHSAQMAPNGDTCCTSIATNRVDI